MEFRFLFPILPALPIQVAMVFQSLEDRGVRWRPTSRAARLVTKATRGLLLIINGIAANSRHMRAPLHHHPGLAAEVRDLRTARTSRSPGVGALPVSPAARLSPASAGGYCPRRTARRHLPDMTSLVYPASETDLGKAADFPVHLTGTTVIAAHTWLQILVSGTMPPSAEDRPVDLRPERRRDSGFG